MCGRQGDSESRMRIVCSARCFFRTLPDVLPFVVVDIQLVVDILLLAAKLPVFATNMSLLFIFCVFRMVIGFPPLAAMTRARMSQASFEIVTLCVTSCREEVYVR